MKATLQCEGGVALVIAIMAIGLLMSLGLGLLLASSSEAIIAGQFRDQRTATYAAEAIVSRAIGDVAAVADWSVIVDGSARSGFVDGPPGGARMLPDGRAIDLTQIVNAANCQKPSTCTISELNAVMAQRPWGVNNPRWQLYAYGPLRDMLSPGTMAAPWYLVLLAAVDPMRLADALALRAEAFGPRSAHSVIELTIQRTAAAASDYNGEVEPSAVRILSWREVR